MGFLGQLKLLLWKNWLLQKRRPVVTILEIILPITFAILLLLIRMIIKEENQPDGAFYPMTKTFIERNASEIGFTPNTTATKQVMDYVLAMLNAVPSNNVKMFTPVGFISETAAEEYFQHNSNKMHHVIVFPGGFNNSNPSAFLKYTLRPYTGSMQWRTDQTFPLFQTNSPRSDTDDPQYDTSGVLHLQHLVGKAITKYWLNYDVNKSLNFEVYKQRMAYPPYVKDNMTFVLQSTFPLFLVLGFILSIIINTKNLVYEKEKELKEAMKLMSLTTAVYWVSWFITFSIYMLPAMAIYAILFSIPLPDKGSVLPNTDPSLFFVYLLCYAFAMISFTFMVSTFVQKANFGAILAGVLFLGLYAPYFFLQPNYENLGASAKLGASILFNCAMSLGANVITIYEGTGEGAQWNNFHKPATVDDDMSLLNCMLMLLVDSAIHLIITWYLENVRPGDYGVPKPFYFCFMKSYWCGSSKITDENVEVNIPENSHTEKGPTSLKTGIQIRNLKKVFRKKVAVAGTSLKMYEGQITVLLGHNGAGKTTTMSMLTGFIPPTSGTAIVNGYDIRNNIDKVRGSLGLCPQHNILFDTLTVREHLQFFAMLKGYNTIKMEEVYNMAHEVGLGSKIDTASVNLSGGQKRKLCVGIALIGGSKVVILDEPTSGMDPAARRQTWNVLQSARHGRTLVLSTHHMDEADLLGDRIAIMAEGVVKCCGSSMFLKKLYGTGYHLVIVKEPACDVDTLTRFIKSKINTAELENIINAEASYLLPDNTSSQFPDLFNALEDQKSELGIASFGTSATTMEEVFLKVGEKNDDVESQETGNISGYGSIHAHANPAFPHDELKSNKVGSLKTKGINETWEMGVSDILSFNQGFKKKTGLALLRSRIWGLFVKKVIHTWRNRTVTLAQLLLPVICIIVGLAIDEAKPAISVQPLLDFNLKPFSNPIIPYAIGIKNNDSQKRFYDLYGKQFTELKENFTTTPGFTFDNYTLKRAKDLGISTFNKRVIIGMEIIDPDSNNGDLVAVAKYNGQPYHGSPTSMNYLLNTMFQYKTNSTVNLESSIHPLPKNEKDRVESDLKMALSSGFSVGFFISFGMAFLTALFIHFLVKEREVGSKHMQVVSGVGPMTYWLPTFLWDFINYMIPCLLVLVVFFAYSKEAYIEDGRWGIVILNLAVYGWAVLPFTYAFQFLFKSPPTGVVVLIMLNIVSGIITTTVIFVLQLPGVGGEDIAKVLDWIFMMLFPNYNMATVFINIYTNYLNLQSCQKVQDGCARGTVFSPCCPQFCSFFPFCVQFQEDYLSLDKPGVGTYVIFMSIQGVINFTIVGLIEYHIFQKLWYKISGTGNHDEQLSHFENENMDLEDSDVAAERQRINALSIQQNVQADSLILSNLYKRYGSFVAVNKVCVGVPEQECFGLLGQNGAGKTTTFKMLTGDVMVTGGNAYLKGFDIQNNIKQVQANMGYCPQFDALIDQMTGRETLIMYARLRGVPEENISMVVNTLIDILMLRPHADKLAGLYSGGNKRKLSTAIALVGDPPFIMLDEPSSGMDPKARRQLWNVLSQVRASGRTLVLTSHSMEECDALCTRIAIMVNGKFKCLGSPQHLKNKFGQGYTLIVQLGSLPDGSTAPNEPVVDFITKNFPEARVFDDHEGYIHFQVPDSNVRLAQVFSLMESTKINLKVSDYSVHQTTLEQVFLTFTRLQVMPKEEEKSSKLSQICCFCCIQGGCYK